MTRDNKLIWKTNSVGIIQGAAVHDSHLIDLVRSSHGLSFRAKRVTGDTVLFELEDLNILKLELWEGVIISEIYAWNVTEYPENSWVDPDNAWNLLFSDRAYDTKGEAEKLIKERPKSLLVHVACSYGGVVVAVCSRLSIYEDH
jgi:hypothetical protein